MVILGDTKFYDVEMMTKYHDVLEGMIVGATFGVADASKLQLFYDKYEKQIMDKTGLLITTGTAQTYDFVHMIAQNVKKSNDSLSFMKNMKSSEGYPGVTDVKFNAKGQLEEDPTYWTVRDGLMYRL